MNDHFVSEEATSQWTKQAHPEGVYSVDMNTMIVASGGEDSNVRLWNRRNGDMIHELSTLHDYIVWNVKLWLDCLFTAGYDCVVNYVTLDYKSSCISPPSDTLTVDIPSIDRICGPFSWADSLNCDHQGHYIPILQIKL